MRLRGRNACRATRPQAQMILCSPFMMDGQAVSSIIDHCIDKVRGRGLRVVFPEADDERIVAAAKHLRDARIADPIVLTQPPPSERLDAYATLYLRGRPEANPKIARRV